MSNSGQGPRASLTRYVVYVWVGAFVGVVTVVLREGVAFMLPSDTPFYYSVSVVVAYAVGMVLSFTLQGRITFRTRRIDRMGKAISLFIAVALIGALATWMLSLAFRYVLQFDAIFGQYGAAAAFVLAALCASVLTYSLNATLVFNARD